MTTENESNPLSNQKKVELSVQQETDMLQKVETGLDEVFIGNGTEEIKSPVPGASVKTPDDSKAIDDIQPDPNEQPDNIPDEVDKPAEKLDGEQTLDAKVADIPPHLWRAAMWHQQFSGLTATELADFWRDNPATAERHFSGYYEAMNRYNTDAAEAGRQQLLKAATDDPKKLPDIAAFDVNQIADDLNISEEAATKLASPLNVAMQHIQAMQAQLEEQHVVARQNQQKTLLETVSSFFASDSMKEFEDFYGPPLDMGNTNVQKVLQQADAIRAGYQLQGQELSPLDALQLAHDGVAVTVIQDKIRQRLRKDLKQRSQGAIHKPSHTRGESGASEDARAQRLDKGLAEVF